MQRNLPLEDDVAPLAPTSHFFFLGAPFHLRPNDCLLAIGQFPTPLVSLLTCSTMLFSLASISVKVSSVPSEGPSLATSSELMQDAPLFMLVSIRAAGNISGSNRPESLALF